MDFLKELKVNFQRLAVSLCIMAVCIGTQQIQTAAWNTGIIEFSRDLLGVLMAVILLTNYKWADFVKYKIPYLIWSVLGIFLGIFFLPRAIEKRLDFLMADTIIIYLGIFLMGYCLIYTALHIFVEKYRPKFYLPLLSIWVVMLILMICSRSEYLWPMVYFVLFLCYYMTDQTPSQRSNVIMGVVDGMILGFVAIQVHSLLFRPYDRLRYYGNFCNPNHNGMFLCMCLGAILAKILFVTKANGKKSVKIFYFLLAGACYAFLCMTMCRSGYLAAFVVTIFFLIAYCRVREKKVFFRMGILLVSIFVCMLPMTYLAVRYIPTIHPHVLFYFQEGYSEDSVHSWDGRDSDKYITFQQMIQGIFGRFGNLKGSLEGVQDESANGQASLELVANTKDLPKGALFYAKAGLDEGESNPNKIPALSSEEGNDAFLIRYTIYKWYFTHLSLRGMPYDEQGFQLTETHWIQDTHNIYLDYGIHFGYPVMILFTVFIWWGIGRLLRQGIQSGKVEKWTCLLIALIPPVFGLFEYAWGVGTISTVAFYLVFKEMLVDEYNH